MLQICDRYLSHNCDRYLSHNCDRYLSHNCDRYLSHNCDRYVMGPNSYMLQICDRYFRTYILQIFCRTVTYICHISVSLVRVIWPTSHKWGLFLWPGWARDNICQYCRYTILLLSWLSTRYPLPECQLCKPRNSPFTVNILSHNPATWTCL